MRFSRSALALWAVLLGVVVFYDFADAEMMMMNGTNQYTQTNLVSDGSVAAITADPNLVNAWGLANLPGSPFWINDNGTGVATLYDGTGVPQPPLRRW